MLAALHKFPGVRPDPEAFIEALDPLQPRLYSISSSLKATPGRVSLTVDAVRYEIGKRTRLGVASTFLAERIAPGDKIKVYVQKAQHFALPAGSRGADHHDRARHRRRAVPRLPAGAAGDRARRAATGCSSAISAATAISSTKRNLTPCKPAGLLTRLSLAWSRDGDEKIYVQHRMREVGRDLWSWLDDGAHIYVCGDALRMAKDVEAALVDIIAQHGGRTRDEAAKFIGELKAAGRYQADVY